MSDETPPAPDRSGPEPVPIRFFGTTWLHHDGGYGLRRAGTAVGSLALAAAGAVVLRFAFQGLQIAEVGSFLNALIVACFAVCSAVAFRRTWERLTRPADAAGDRPVDRSAQSMQLIGFIGSLLAYFCRTLVEAPGEGLRRAEYEAERERYERRRKARTGNPAAKKTKKKRG
ncbi:hypothetical protein ACH4FX_25050 [Streptomyces sp. NPDC018019]|uniref:hypothetical protein n=1 Tax=Streptomyces sp. NPDC018019 TaxID=3365030 RepID=UPI0037BCAEFB